MEQTVAYKRKWREKVWSLKWKSTRSISRKLRTTDILPQRIFYYRIKIAASSKVSVVETDTDSSMPRSRTKELVHARKNVKKGGSDFVQWRAAGQLAVSFVSNKK